MTATLLAVEPAHLWIPPRAGSYADEVVDFAQLWGQELDPEQVTAVDAITSYRPDGGWAALEAAIIEGRQNGKTDGIMAPVVLADFFLFDADHIEWTAHLFRTCRKAFLNIQRIIDGTPELSRRVKKINASHGEESVELHTGALLEFLARSKGGGRGLGGKRLVLDEALFLSAESMGALIPTLSARPDPQILYGSSAGKAESDHLRNLRDRGRRGGDPSLAYVEFGAAGGWDEPGCDTPSCTHVVGSDGCTLDDEDAWRRANPALGRRITIEYVRKERRALPPAEFGRERLGWWDLPIGGIQPIDQTGFAACAISLDSVDRGRDVVFFLDAAPQMRSACITAGLAGEKPHTELADYRAGAHWLAERAADLKAKHPKAMWFAWAGGAVSAQLPALAEHGIEPELFTITDMGRACGHLQNLVASRGFTHSGDPLFAAAFAGAVKRDVGEGLWVWGWRNSTTDISPLYGITGALWALAQNPHYDPLANIW